MRRALSAFLGLAALLALATAPALAAEVGFGQLYYNGQVVRTVVPPAAFPDEGTDNFYEVEGGVSGQLGIAAVAPGAAGYHGGHWKVFHVRFTGTPVLLTSEAAVLGAAAAGAVAVTRTPGEDFLCPIQP